MERFKTQLTENEVGWKVPKEQVEVFSLHDGEVTLDRGHYEWTELTVVWTGPAQDKPSRPSATVGAKVERRAKGLPGWVKSLIPAVVALVGGVVTGYFASGVPGLKAQLESAEVALGDRGCERAGEVESLTVAVQKCFGDFGELEQAKRKAEEDLKAFQEKERQSSVVLSQLLALAEQGVF